MLTHLEPIVRLGLARALAEDDIVVLGDERDGDDAVLTAQQALPDAIVLGGDDERSTALAARLRAAAPGATLILFARDEDGSQIFDPSSGAPRQIGAPVAEALLAELAATRSKTEEPHA